MLVLSRDVNEKLVIEGPCEITVLRVRGNTVRIGIQAQRHVRVRRGELPPPLASADVPPIQEPANT